MIKSPKTPVQTLLAKHEKRIAKTTPLEDIPGFKENAPRILKALKASGYNSVDDLEIEIERRPGRKCSLAEMRVELSGFRQGKFFTDECRPHDADAKHELTHVFHLICNIAATSANAAFLGLPQQNSRLPLNIPQTSQFKHPVL